MMRHFTPTRVRCFSLFEVVIVLVIIAIILGLVAPRIGYMASGIQRSEFMATLNSAFHLASSIATSTGRPATLRFNFDGKSIDIDSSGTTSTVVAGVNGLDGDNPVRGSIFDDLKSFTIPEDTEPDTSYTNLDEPPEYTFYPNGEAVGPTVTMIVSESWKVTVDVDRLTGRPLINIQDY